MKEFLKGLWGRMIVKVLVFLVAGILIVSFATWAGGYFPRQNVLDKYLKQQEQELTKKFDEQIALKNEEITSLNGQISELEQKYSGLKSSYSKLKKEKANVQKPKDTTDTVSRLRALGYNPSVR